MQSSLPRALQAIEPRFHAVRLTRNASEGDASRRLLHRTRYRTYAGRLLSPCIRTSLTRDELLCSSSADRAQIYLVPMSSRAMRRHLLPPARTHQACLPPSRQLLPLRLLFDALPLRPCRRVSTTCRVQIRSCPFCRCRGQVHLAQNSLPPLVGRDWMPSEQAERIQRVHGRL